ncbi:hypothetical protein LXA43DRAFT_1091402 [Ganoderma leucocontextum]|nr:hypothetical protein LXA43DRAFT_1091402 [Ganoderma leucocontextum]
MSLLSLSPELVVHILSYLHYADLHACRRVNLALNRLIQGSILLQYSMQLQLSGYEDNPSSPMAIVDKLRLLRQQEAAWSRLDFQKPKSVRIPFIPSSIYDLTDGILLLGEHVCGLHSGADKIRWARLSGLASEDTSVEPWEKIDVGAHIIDVGLAVQEHDLIVVATDRETDDHQTIFELRLIQLSTGISHPLAATPVLTLATIPSPPHQVTGQCSVCIEIIGDLLCFMFHYPSGSTTPPAMFEVYNWKTGQCLQLRGIDCPSYSTFTFLAPDIIALPNCTDNAIELCRIGAEPGTCGQPLELQTSCVLQLPRLGSGHSIAQVTCRSEPKVTNVMRYARAFRSRDPFHQNPENAIVIFNVMTHDAHGFHECLTLIVHTASLLSVLAAKESPIPESPAPDGATVFGQSGLPSSDHPRSVPWNQWGPRCCRWLETSFGASRWITTTCGQRYVTVEEDPIEDDSRSSTIVVYDFNPHTVRRLAAAHRKKRRRLRGYWDVTLPEGELAVGSGEGLATFTRLESGVLIPFTDPKTRVIGQIQCEPTELMAGYAMEYRIFDEAVRTCLPYAQLSSFETFGYGAVLLDRNMVIGVKLNELDDIKELVIHSIGAGSVG